MAKQRLTFVLFLSLCFSLSLSGQKNVTKPNVHGPMGFKVNTYTGNLFYQRQDLFIPGRGLDVDLTFTYNSSKRNRDWGMGKGWTFMYNMAYELEGQDVIVERMDGRKDHFTFNGGSYQAPTGLYDVLEQYESEKYRIRMKDGTLYFFDDPAHRRLTGIEDRNGNAITLSYTDSLVTTITGASGRDVSLGWTGGHLTNITFSGITPARTYQYEYDNGQLFRMTNPMGFMVQYQYDDRGRMKEMVDENGNPITIVYDDRGAVKELNSCLSAMSIAYNLTSRKTYVVEKVGQGEQVTTYQYDEQGRLTSQTGNCCGYNLAFEYDEDNNVVKRTDANGNATIFNYDGRGNVVREIDPLGNFMEFTYEPVFNQVSSVTDKRGNTTSFTYDANGNLTQIDFPLGIQESFTYDNFGYRTSYTDGKGNTTSYEYNINGDLIRIINALGAITEFTFDEIGNILSTTDPNGNVNSFTYDAINRRLSLTDVLNNTELYSYDNRNNIISITDKGGNVTLLTYDALGRLTIKEDALGQKVINTLDSKGNILSVRDENGNEAQYEYDNLNRLVSMINAEGEATNIEYDVSGNITGVRLPNDNYVTIQYDALDRSTQVSDQLGSLSSFTYDKNSNRTSFTDGNGNSVNYEYDALDRLIGITDPSGRSINYVYDNNDNVTFVTDRNGRVTSYNYDNINRQTTVIDALNYSSSYSYDDFGNLISITDQNNNTTTYSYDALHRITLETQPDGTSIGFTYNSAGQVIQRNDNNGNVTTYQYDDLYRLTSRNYPDNSIDEFTYDAVGNIVSASNSSASIVLTYDKINRLISENLNGKTTVYFYDIKNKQRKIIYPGGREIVEQLDARARLESITDNTYLIDVLASFEYDEGNRRIKGNYSNNTFTYYGYDVNSRLTSKTHILNDTYGYNYAYDYAGNRIKEEKVHQQSASRQFEYDGLYRLINSKLGTLSGNVVINPISEFQFNIDALGNRITLDSNGIITTYTTNNLNQYTGITGGQNVLPGYDDNGNLLSNGAHNFSFDYEDRLIEVDNGSTAIYEYGPLGRRIKKIIGLDTTYYYYDNLKVIEERGNNEIIKVTYVYGKGLDEVISMHRFGNNYFYHSDGLGSITQITDNAGNLVEQYIYDAYGNPKIFDGSSNLLASSSIGNPYLFAGRRLDAETRFYYYRTRYYSSELGRFIQRDPIGFVDGLSLYAYSFDNPVNWIDPLGLSSDPCDKPLWESALDGFQTALDIAGLVPGIGEPFDLVNAGIYAARGDYGNAGLSVAAMVPVGGQAATAAKLGAKYGDDVVQEAGKFGDDLLDAGRAGNKAADGQKTYQTYTKTNPETGEVYSGRTSGKGTPEENIVVRDRNHHMNDKGFGPSVLDKSSTNKDAIRGREQQLIDSHGGAKSQGGTSGNAINGISPKNSKRNQYNDAANREFGNGS